MAGPGPGTIGYSRYSYLVDGGPCQPVLCTRRVMVGPGDPTGHEQDPVALCAGTHTLEFRFYPQQRLRSMNRVDQAYVGHNVIINHVRLVRVHPTCQRRLPVRSPDQQLQWHDGDSVVLRGDSITDEGLYARHLARMLATAYPGATNTPNRRAPTS